VVATRAPRLDPVPKLDRPRAPSLRPRTSEGAARAVPESGPPPRVVRPPQEGRTGEVTQRAPFGKRSEIERSTPPPAPRYQRPAVGEAGAGPQRVSPPERRGDETPRSVPSLPERVERPGATHMRERPASQAPVVRPPSTAPGLPGEPANRVYRWERSGREGAPQRSPAVREPQAERGSPQQPGGAGRGMDRPGGGFEPRGRGPGR
jgi:hypothetical protein